MNRPENFETEQEGAAAQQTPAAQPAYNAQDTADDIQNTAAGAQNPDTPRWYGISYEDHGAGYEQNRGYPPVSMAPPPRKGRRLGLIALLLAACVLLSAAAGFVGSLVGNSLLSSPDGGTPGVQVSGNGTDDGGEVYGTDGDSSYRYEDATLEQKDGSALAGNPNGSAGENKGTTITAAAIAKDAVVEIMTTTTSNYGRITAGAGSGVIIHADGIIVTNHHVIDGATTVRVRLTSGNTYEAVVRGSDEDGDIAVIKIQPRETLTVARIGSSAALALGEEVIAIGNPLGELGGTVTNGIISALERQVNVDGVVMTLIQTNAAINSGNSGGGLFNLAGELIGVVNAKYAAEGVEGLGFAIPVDAAIVSINHLLELGYIPGIPALGVDMTVQPATLSGSRIYMPYVSNAPFGSALKQGDYIYSVNGEPVVVGYSDYNKGVDPLNVLKQVIRAHKVGDTVTLVVYRNSVATTVQVTLAEYIPTDSSVNFG